MSVPQALTFPEELRSRVEEYLPPHEPCTGSSTFQENRPFVTLTYAASLDSQIAIANGVQTAISGPETKAMTHYLRYRHDSIAIGSGTLQADNPGLNCRLEDALLAGQTAQPLPVILDRSGRSRWISGMRVLDTARSTFGKYPMTFMNETSYLRWSNDDTMSHVIEMGVFVEKADCLEEVLGRLHELGIRSIMIEGGASVINHILSQKISLVDSIIITLGPVMFGQGGLAVCPPRFGGESLQPLVRFQEVRWIPMGQDVVMFAKVKKIAL